VTNDMWQYAANRPETGIEYRQAFMPVKTSEVAMSETTTERRESLPLSEVLAGASLAVVGTDQMRTRRSRGGRGTRERSKEQKLFDDLVSKAYDKWTLAGKPKKFTESPGGAVKVRDDELVILTVQRAIRRSGAYLDFSVRFGLTDPDEEGNVTILFRVSDPRPADSDDSDDSEDDSEDDSGEE
jgi:hypothetical protein